MTGAEPQAVLFVCNLNRVRSPMAETLLRRAAGRRIYVDSCGLQGVAGDDIAAEIDPLARAVLAELGCEPDEQYAKTFEDLDAGAFDLVISLTPEAHARAQALARGRALEIEYWPTPDPTGGEGSRESRLEAYRQVRDLLARRIAERFGR